MRRSWSCEKQEEAQCGAAFVSKVDFVAQGVGHADPLRFCKEHYLRNICFAMDLLGSDLSELGACVQPHAQWLALHHSFWAKCVQEAMPVSGVYLLQSASTTVHVFVKRGHRSVWSVQPHQVTMLPSCFLPTNGCIDGGWSAPTWVEPRFKQFGVAVRGGGGREQQQPRNPGSEPRFNSGRNPGSNPGSTQVRTQCDPGFNQV